jgi:hypothetical protein
MRTTLCLVFVALFAPLASSQEIGRPIEDGKGVMVVAEGGLSMCIMMVEHRVRVAFVDEAGLVVECPFEKVVLHMERVGQSNDEIHLVMRPEAGMGYITHPRAIPPPEIFHMRIILYPEEGSERGRIVIPRVRFRG